MLSTRVDRAPRFTAGEAAGLAARYFGIHGPATTLPSERDQNFRLTDPAGSDVVLKIANADEESAVLEMQNQAMAVISASDSSLCPGVIPALSGQSIVRHEEGGVHYALRVLSYIPGRPLAQVKPKTTALFQSVGALLGRLDHALSGFDHPAAHRGFPWDLARAQQVVEAAVPELDSEGQSVIQPILARYRREVAPRLSALRMGVIHGDGNDYNVMVAPDPAWRMQATGVIDFGDMVYSHIINEAAIAGAYAMLDAPDPLAAASALVQGFHDVYPLTDAEAHVVYDLMCMRLAVSVCLAAIQQTAAPDNEYLLISQAPIRRLLARLQSVSTEQARAAMRHVCGYAPTPSTSRILTWLASDQCTPAALFDDRSLTQAPVLNLAVDSRHLTSQLLQPGSQVARALLAASGESAAPTCAIGRYGEARLLTDAYVLPARPEGHPSISLGLTLFGPAGTPVYAPLTGAIVDITNVGGEGGLALLVRHQTTDGDSFLVRYEGVAPTAPDQLQIGIEIAAGQRLGVIARGGVGDCPPHLFIQLIVDDFGLGAGFPRATHPDQAPFWLAVAPNPAPLLGLDPAAVAAPPGRSRAELLAERRRHLSSNLSISYDAPLKIVRGLRQYLYDNEGRAYLDVVNNVCHVGHCHPDVVAAGQSQMAVLNTNTRYLHDNLGRYAERLLAKFPAPLEVVFLVCSGSEANELALRLARTYTGRNDIIMLDAAYHGNTQALVDISPYKHDGPGGGGAPSWAHAAVMPDPYRGLHKGYDQATGAAYAEDIRDLVARLDANGRPPAALITETVLGCGGQVVLPQGYLAAAYAHVRAAGGLCIADEVQVGFGRVGSHFWGWETQGVVPDIVTMGKPIGNGHPMAAVVTTRAVADAFANGMEYFNTFGGNPVSCAIGNAVLDVIEREALQANARTTGAQLLAGLTELKQRYPLIGDVRGLGLFVGAELVTDRSTLAPAAQQAAYIANRMREHGILISTDGPLHNVLKMKPPMVFDTSDADRVVATLDHILAEDCLQINP